MFSPKEDIYVAPPKHWGYCIELGEEKHKCQKNVRNIMEYCICGMT